MNIIRLFKQKSDVFPKEVTMDFIRRIKRKEITAEEKRKPFVKYFYREVAKIPPADLTKF